MTVSSDASLVSGLRSGDREAFKAAYDRYKSDVLALVAAMLGAEDSAWDVLHDVFVSLAAQARQLAPNSNLKGYLLTSAANRARDCLKRRALIARHDAHARTVLCTTEDPLTIAAREEEADHLKHALASLPEDQRVVVAMHIYGEFTFKEVAANMGVSESTVQSRYRYALEKLRRHYRGGDK